MTTDPRHVALAVVTAALLAPAPALAQPLDRAVDTAHAVHPEVRALCPAGVALSVADLEVAGRAWRTQCRVEVDADLVRGYPWPRLCSVVVHEWGHLAGLGHSTGGNMAPEAGHHPACGPTLEALEHAVQRAERREIRAYDRRWRTGQKARRVGSARLRMRARRARRAHAIAQRELSEARRAVYASAR